MKHNLISAQSFGVPSTTFFTHSWIYLLCASPAGSLDCQLSRTETVFICWKIVTTTHKNENPHLKSLTTMDCFYNWYFPNVSLTICYFSEDNFTHLYIQKFSYCGAIEHSIALYEQHDSFYGLILITQQCAFELIGDDRKAIRVVLGL